MVELLVVVSIIALLIAILLPSLQKAREQTKSVVCKTRLKAIGTAGYTYSTEFERYPPSHANLRGSRPDFVAPNRIYTGPSGIAGIDWLGVGGHLDQPYVKAPANNPKGGTPAGFDAAPKLGLIWPYVRDEEAYRCPSDRVVPIGQYKESVLKPVTENWKFSYTMYANLGLRSPDNIPSRMSDPVSGGPRGTGGQRYRLGKRPLSAVPNFVEEHPNGIGRFVGGHVEGTFNTTLDRFNTRHVPFEKRKGRNPLTPSVLSEFTQGTTNMSFADGHVETVRLNYGMTYNDAKPTTTGGSWRGIPDNSEDLWKYYGLECGELQALDKGGTTYYPCESP